MGCGCSKRVIRDSDSYVSDSHSVSVSEPVVSERSAVTPVSKPCFEKDAWLSSLDGKCVDLYNKFKDDDFQKASVYVEYQKKIRDWKHSLVHRCPDEEDFLRVSNSINSDYSKYI